MSQKHRKKKDQPLSEEDKKRQYGLSIARLRVFKIAFMTVVICSSIVGFGYVTIALPVQASHGEITTITVVQNWVANIKASVYIAWGATGVAGGGAWVMRRRWLKERGEKDARIAQLERQ